MQVGIPASAFALTLLKSDHEGTKEFIASFFVTNGITHVIKFSTGKTALGKRPNGGTRSFPSGHSAAVFHGAFFLQDRYGSKYGIPAIGLSIFTGYSRVQGKYHHARDVVGAIAIAYVASDYIVTKFNNENAKLGTLYSKDTVGMKLNLKL